jgi:hypothetical protein
MLQYRYCTVMIVGRPRLLNRGGRLPAIQSSADVTFLIVEPGAGVNER